MPDLLLVGASGLAREALAVVRSTRSHRVVGLLDDDPGRWGTVVGGVPVLGGLAEAAAHPGAEFVLCVGRGSERTRIATRLAGAGVSDDGYATIVHPSVDVPTGCSVGPGSIVLAQVALTADVQVERHVVLMPHVTLTHDDVLHDFVTVAAGVSLGGGVTVGARAYLGMGSTVREGLAVGVEAVLGMGAALICDLPAGETWVGVPARPLLGSGRP